MNPLKLFGVTALAVICLTVSSTIGFSQNIGVNNPTPDASALLDLTSTTKGFLIPRMTSAQRVAIAVPATGLLVYDTSLGLFYYFNGAVWIPLSGSSVTADNGLSIVPANNVRLGGSSLLSNTEVGLNNFNMAWNGQGSMTIGTNVPATGFLLTMTPNSATWRSGISMTLTNAGSTAYGMDVTTGNSNVNGIRVTHSSSSLSSGLYGIGSILSSTNIVSGYLGYRTGSGNTYGVFGITGTNAAYVSTNASTWAGFFEGRTVISGESAPTSALGTDLEVRNTTPGAGNPATIGLRQSTAVTSISSPLGRINFGDNYSTTAPQAQILAVRGNTSSSAADVPTDIIFSNTPDGSNILTERMRILYDGNVGIGTATPAAKLHIVGSLRMVDGTQAAGRVMRSDANGTGSWQTLTASDANAWGLTGNAGTVDGTNFLGTTDNVPLNFRVNNARAGRVESTGGTYLGYQSGNIPPSGIQNTGMGYGTLSVTTSGSNNTATGYNAMAVNTTGFGNTASGSQTLVSNVGGWYNSSMGFRSLYSNTSGNNNTANGTMALYNNISGYENVAVGMQSLYTNQTGNWNTALGYASLNFNTAGYNTAIGASALSSNQTGYSNVAVGIHALRFNTLRSNIVAIGDSALYNNNASSTAGGYYNTAVGSKALFANLAGNNNTAVGYNSSYSNYNGNNNSSFGCLSLNTNYSGANNTAIGYQALYQNFDGYGNTSVGTGSLQANTSGDYNIALGFQALFSNQTGNYNLAMGLGSLSDNLSGNFNTAIGVGALGSNIGGSYATAVGYGAMTNSNNTSTLYTNYSVALGFQALMGSGTPANNTGNNNSAIGYQSLYSNSSGSYNTGNGGITLYDNTTGHRNTALGYAALTNNIDGAYNTVVGVDALFLNTSGSYNTVVGYRAGYVGTAITTGTYNTLIGFSTLADLSSRTNCVGIGGNGNLSFGGDNRVRIGNGAMTSIGGQVGWTTISDERVKTNIRDDVTGLAFIMKLKPVTYQYSLALSNRLQNIRDTLEWNGKYDIENIRFSGFLSQQVENAAIESGYSFSGVDKPQDVNGLWGLRYAEFTVPLVKAVQEQQQMIEELKHSLQLLQEENRALKNRIELLENK